MKNSRNSTKAAMQARLGTAAALAAGLFAMPAFAIDVDAGDYTALPAGTNLGLVYYQQASRDKLYAKGSQVPIRAGLDSDVGILRGVHFMEIGGYIVDPQFLLPFGRLKGKNDMRGLGSENGIADLILAATVWITKPGQKEHFGITPFLFLPTGDYDRNAPLNLGENRWKAALQAGWIKPLGDSVTMDLIADVTVHGKNKEVGASSMTQVPLFQFQGHLRYHLSPTADLRFGLSQTSGGETSINGVAQDDRTSTSKFSLGAAFFVTPKTQLLATYGRDISVRQGPKEDGRLNLRLLQIF